MTDASIRPSVARLPRIARPATDAQLAARAAAGDRAAFEEIFRRHHQAVYRYCLSILGEREDAADALQATMAALVRVLDGETRTIDLRPWLMRIAHNQAVSLLRARRPQERLDEEQPSNGGPDDELERSESVRRLLSDIRGLPEKPRSALVMRELTGLSYAEIAQALGGGEGAARQAVCEARTMLHELADGRDMACDEVQTLISERDGRRLRGRRVRAHLSACGSCTAFRAAIGTRRAGLAAAAPVLPAPAAASVLQAILGGGSAGTGGLVAGAAASATTVSGAASPGLAGAALGVAKTGAAAVGAKATAALATGAVVVGGGAVALEPGPLGRDEPQAPPRESVATPDRPGPARAPGRAVSVAAPTTSGSQDPGEVPPESTRSGRGRGDDRPIRPATRPAKPARGRDRPAPRPGPAARGGGAVKPEQAAAKGGRKAPVPDAGRSRPARRAKPAPSRATPSPKTGMGSPGKARDAQPATPAVPGLGAVQPAEKGRPPRAGPPDAQ